MPTTSHGRDTLERAWHNITHGDTTEHEMQKNYSTFTRVYCAQPQTAGGVRRDYFKAAALTKKKS